jgi:hypothetical protein
MAASRVQLEQLSEGFRLEIGPSAKLSERCRFLSPTIGWFLVGLFLLWFMSTFLGVAPTAEQNGDAETAAQGTGNMPLIMAVFAVVWFAGVCVTVFLNARMMVGRQFVEVEGNSLRAHKRALRTYAVHEFPLDSVQRFRVHKPDPRRNPQYFGPCRMQIDVDSREYTLLSGLDEDAARNVASALQGAALPQEVIVSLGGS